MAFLNIFSIADMLKQPSGVWEWLILSLFGFIQSYGWRIILFTIALKLLLFPLDLYQRVKMRKNQKITERMKPQLEKLQEQYGSDKTVFAQKQMELNKKEGFSYFSSCLPMIITMVIFFWLFAGLNNISQYMNIKQYVELYDVYVAEEAAYKAEHKFDTITDLDEKEKVQKDAVEFGQNKVVQVYDERGKENFLWIKNIWSPDVPWTPPIKNYKDFVSVIGDYGKKPEKLGIDPSTFKSLTSGDMYDKVTGKLQKSPDNKTNGYLILPILSVGLSFLSQFITNQIQKKSGQVNNTGGMAGSMKVMMIMMPIMMGFFALTYTSAFTIYIVINSLMTIVLNLIMTMFMALLDHKKEVQTTTGIQHYGRPDPFVKDDTTSMTRAERKAMNAGEPDKKRKTYKDIIKKK